MFSKVARRGVGRAVYRDAVMADAPVGYWRLGEPPGLSSPFAAADASGNANPGTYSNGGGALAGVTLGRAALVSGSDGAALFDGLGGHVTVPRIGAYLLTSSIAAEAWVRVSSL